MSIEIQQAVVGQKAHEFDFAQGRFLIASVTITDDLANIPAFVCDVRWPQCSLRQVHPDK
jgi:hypothetical protein